MSTIDQAFVKAFQKNRRKVDSAETRDSSEDHRAAALGMSTIWIDPGSDQSWRSDQAHAQPQRIAGSPARDRQPVRPQPTAPGGHISLPVVTPAEPIPAAAIDLHMFDAIDVAPSPLAFGSPAPATEVPPAAQPVTPQPPSSLEPEAPAPSEPQLRIDPANKGKAPRPHSVPFVKIHERQNQSIGDARFGQDDVPMSAGVSEAKPAVEQVAPFEAAWEVDRFEPPTVVTALLEQRGLEDAAIAPLADAVKAGLQTLLVTSAAAQQGRTTVAVGLAMAAARTGLRVALLDLDTERPALADRLQLEVEAGWTTGIRQRMPLEESAIYSLHDRLTAFPIIPTTPSLTPLREEIVKTLSTLRRAFDLVVIDAAAIDMDVAMRTPLPASQIDSALVIRDGREPSDTGFEECVVALRQLGIDHIGVVDNFVTSASNQAT